MSSDPIVVCEAVQSLNSDFISGAQKSENFLVLAQLLLLFYYGFDTVHVPYYLLQRLTDLSGSSGERVLARYSGEAFTSIRHKIFVSGERVCPQ